MGTHLVIGGGPVGTETAQHQVVDELADAAGVPHVRVTRLPSFIAQVLGVFNPAIRAFEETAYQRDRAFVLDDSAARTAFHIDPTAWPEVLQRVIACYRRAGDGT